MVISGIGTPPESPTWTISLDIWTPHSVYLRQYGPYSFDWAETIPRWNRNFNADLSRWDTRRVTSAVSMFERALSFNSDISTWNTSQLTNMNRMFYSASAFNQSLCCDISRDAFSVVVFVGSKGTLSEYPSCLFPIVYNILSNSNIHFAAYLWVSNQSAALASFGHLSLWDTSRVSNMDCLFSPSNPFFSGHDIFSYSLNGNVSSWNTSRVTTMSRMFQFASSFSGDLSSWNTSLVTSMYGMFDSA